MRVVPQAVERMAKTISDAVVMNLVKLFPFDIPDKPGENGDQTCEVFWRCFIADYGKDFDIVIDDGGHFNDGIITSFNGLWPYVKPGGFYAVEDLGCAYGPGSIFVKPGFYSHMEWLHQTIDNLNIGIGTDSIYFSRELAVLRKAL